MLLLNKESIANKLFLNFILIIFIFLTIALFLRLINLHKDFSCDEPRLIEISQLNFKQIIPVLKQREVYPPLTFILIHYWEYLNNSQIWIRLYFVFFGLGTCFLIYLIAKEYFNREVAIISLLLATFSPLLIFASQYARSYIDSTFWMLLSTFFMLKIVQGNDRLINWILYIIVATLSLYTFYFCIFLFIGQFIFISIFQWRNKKAILKWYFAFLLIALFFMPWLPSAMEQFKNVSSIIYDCSAKGFNLGSLRLGLYTRNISSLIGFDPYFMVFRGGITAHFSRLILLTAVIICFNGCIFFLYIIIKYLKTRFKQNNSLVWFLPFMGFLPVIISWIFSGLLSILPNAKYFIFFHALFLILISIFIYKLGKKNLLIGILATVLILGIFTIRIPAAVAPEFDTRGALSFLKENFNKDSCLLCISVSPPDNSISNIIKIGEYFKLNDRGSEYIVSSPKAWEELMIKINSFKKVWVYWVTAGTIEIFGANHLLDNRLKNEGYKPVKIKNFRNINIVIYEK